MKTLTITKTWSTEVNVEVTDEQYATLTADDREEMSEWSDSMGNDTLDCDWVSTKVTDAESDEELANWN